MINIKVIKQFKFPHQLLAIAQALHQEYLDQYFKKKVVSKKKNKKTKIVEMNLSYAQEVE